MSTQASTFHAAAGVRAKERSAAATVPWYLWMATLAVTCAMTGIHWDISWHRSIGRDTFWTPPHLLIQLCGVLAGITCGYLILATTMGKNPELKPSCVRIWGLYGPLGAFIAAWGGVAMITSAPFDDWWHQAYGLDVKIISPPHMVLALGIVSVEVGALILLLAFLNRASEEAKPMLRWMFLYIASMILVITATILMEETFIVVLHAAYPYEVLGFVLPFVLLSMGRASGDKWGATIIAGVYTVFYLLLLWILPLFPAEPKLGPVLHPVTQFIPPGFPLAVLVPAFLMDWISSRFRETPKWLPYLLGAVCFLTFLAAEWPLAGFLLQSPAAQNPIFGSIYRDYIEGPRSYIALHRFIPREPLGLFGERLLIGLCASMVMARAAFASAAWMKRVRR
ncbi:MAG TPA: hypothetical protein VGL53_30595 [Bryobacteraceae bacterium]